MTQDLSPADLSKLWLLRDRHTTKEAVEKAIYYGLPLWPEAVNLARAYHRSQKDLAGGKYYIIGSEFIENEPDSPYSYHELGRYPADWLKYRSHLVKPFETSHVDNSGYDSPISCVNAEVSAPESGSLSTWKEAFAKSRFENDRNKHIELFLGGVSALEIENLQTRRNVLNICQISEDGNSECENENDSFGNSLSLLSCKRRSPSDTFINEHVNVPKRNKFDNGLYSDCEAVQNLESAHNITEVMIKEKPLPCESSRVLNSKETAVSVQKGKETPQKIQCFDFSMYESELLRRCEEQFLKPNSPIRNFSRIIPIEELQSLMMDTNESYTPTVSDTASMRDASEEENASVNWNSSLTQEVQETQKVTVIYNGNEEVNAPELPEKSNFADEKAKRCYVDPFEGSSSVVESDLADDDVIGTNIFLEISEHRRQEGASSPSACSDHSSVALPPNVFVWLPQTCDVNLLTRFRSLSPNANCEIVLPFPRTAVSNLCLKAPNHAEVLVSADLLKSFNHSGAFALKRGPVRGRSVSLNCDVDFKLLGIFGSQFIAFRSASKNARSCVAYDIKNRISDIYNCEVELTPRQLQRACLGTAASEDISVDISKELIADITNVSNFASKELAVNASDNTSICCRATRYESVNSTWVFHAQIDMSAYILLQEKFLYQLPYRCKGCIRNKKRRSAMISSRKRKYSDSMEECLMLLETGAMPSQIIDDRTCADSEPLEIITDSNEWNEIPDYIEFGISKPCNLEQIAVEGSSLGSDRSDSPGRLVIVEDFDSSAQDSEMPGNLVTKPSSYLCAPMDVKNESCTLAKFRCSSSEPPVINETPSFVPQPRNSYYSDAVSQSLVANRMSPLNNEFLPSQNFHPKLESRKQVTLSPIKKFSNRAQNKGTCDGDALFELSTAVRASHFVTIEESDSSVSVKKRKIEQNDVIVQSAKKYCKRISSFDDPAILPKKRVNTQKKRLDEQIPTSKSANHAQVSTESSPVSPVTIDLLLSTTKCTKQQVEERDSIAVGIVEPAYESSPAQAEDVAVITCHSTDILHEEQFKHVTMDLSENDKLSNRSSKQSPTSNDNHAKDDRLITKSTVTRSSKTRNGRNILPSSSKSDALLPNKDTVEQVITSLQEEQVPTSKSNVSVLPNLCTKTSKKNEMSNHHVALTSSSGLRGRKTNRSRNLFIESPISSTQAKRRKCDFGYNITFGEMENANISVFERSSFVTRSRTRAESSKSTPSVARSAFNSRCRKSLKHNIPASEDSSDDVVLIKRDRHREKSPTPPILVVAVNTTSSFVPVKRDNCRHADVITLPTCNKGEAVKTTIYSSDSAEILNALALEIIIKEASILSAVNLATFAQLVFNLFETSNNVFGDLMDIEPSTLPANFTTIFERTSPLRFRHRLDYHSFSSMLINSLPENGLRALTLDSRRVSMLKIAKFVDTIKEAVDEICEELRTRENLSKAEVQAEKDLSSEVQQLISSRYVETVMKLVEACAQAIDVPLKIISDRFHLLLFGWDSFLLQGGVLRVRLQLSPGRSHPGIIDVTTNWLDQIDTVLSRAQATLSTRTSAFAVSLAQEKNIMSKVWHKMAAQTSSSFIDQSFIYCSECKLYFHNEDTDFMHNRIFHQKSRECEECYDMFHTLLGLDLHMVGYHKRSFVGDV